MCTSLGNVQYVVQFTLVLTICLSQIADISTLVLCAPGADVGHSTGIVCGTGAINWTGESIIKLWLHLPGVN